ncbi:MAG: hypothetical protein WC438_05285 [Candidatus Pacearchaeota archaeon]
MRTIKKVTNYGTSTILNYFNIQKYCVKDFKIVCEMKIELI